EGGGNHRPGDGGWELSGSQGNLREISTDLFLSKKPRKPGYFRRNCLEVSHRSRLTGSALRNCRWGGTVAVSPHGDSAMNDACSPDTANTLPLTPNTPYAP